MREITVDDLYFKEIKSCLYNIIEGTVTFEINGEFGDVILVVFSGVSNLFYSQSDEPRFDSEISFYPIEDVVFKRGSYRLNKSKKMPYNVVLDSCVSTWYIFARQLEIQDSEGKSSVFTLTIP